MKLALLLLIATINMWGQKQAPIWQQVFTNLTTSPAVSVNVKNIGQTFHQVYAVLSNSGGVCNSVNMPMQLEGSYDNINFIPFTPVVGVNGTIFTGTTNIYQMYGAGTYPFIRLRIITLQTNCAANVYYSGALDSAPPDQYTQATILGYITDIAANKNTTGKATLARTTIANKKLYFSKMVFSASANPITVSIETGGVDCSLGPLGSPVWSVTLPASATTTREVVFPFTGAPHLVATAANQMCVYWTAGETATIESQYRLEN